MAGAGILLVEDNPNDEELTCGVLSSHQLLCPVTVVRNGAEALRAIRADPRSTLLPVAIL